MAAKDSSDISSDSESSFELEHESDGVIRPFMFEPQHGTSSEDECDSNMPQDAPEAVEYTADETSRSRLGNRDWCICSNCQVMPSETESIYCQEMNVLEDRLDLEGSNETFILNNKHFTCGNLLCRMVFPLQERNTSV